MASGSQTFRMDSSFIKVIYESDKVSKISLNLIKLLRYLSRVIYCNVSKFMLNDSC